MPTATSTEWGQCQPLDIQRYRSSMWLERTQLLEPSTAASNISPCLWLHWSWTFLTRLLWQSIIVSFPLHHNKIHAIYHLIKQCRISPLQRYIFLKHPSLINIDFWLIFGIHIIIFPTTFCKKKKKKVSASNKNSQINQSLSCRHRITIFQQICLSFYTISPH